MFRGKMDPYEDFLDALEAADRSEFDTAQFFWHILRTTSLRTAYNFPPGRNV